MAAADPSLPLQIALISAIKAVDTEAGTNVFDTVPPTRPPGGPFPRITVDGGQTLPDGPNCYDGSELFVQIDAWSREPGFPQVKRIASDIRQRLHNGDLIVDGHVVELIQIQSIVYQRDPDGLTSRARISLRALTHPAEA